MTNLVSRSLRTSAVLSLVLCAACHDASHGHGDGGVTQGDLAGTDGAMIPLGALIGVSIAPHGAALQTGSMQQFTATCSYEGGASDDCTKAGGASFTSSRTTAITVTSSGLATAAEDPGPGMGDGGYVVVKAGAFNDRALIMIQHPGDTYYTYPTPDVRRYGNSNPTFVVGSTVTIGAGVVTNNDASGGQTTGSPFGETCTWTSSAPNIATVDLHGQVTAVAPGTVTITCTRSGDAVYGSSAISGWVAPGNTVTLDVVAGGTGNTTWYVRPDGGTPYVDATTTPMGQCDGKADAPYPGTGVNQHCAMGNLRYLWADGVTSQVTRWMIAGGDTVLVAPNPSGYNTGLDQASPYASPPGSAFVPVNCGGNPYCTMPPIPSGTAAHHTRILGTGYMSCHDDAMKTKLSVSYSASAAFDVTDSQFVDIACFEITDRAACMNSGNYTNNCHGSDLDYGDNAIIESALTSMTTYTDLAIHGLASNGIFGPTGVGVVIDHVRISGGGQSGINMDDAAWNSSNISLAGGLTLTSSLTEFSGCVEEYPITHMVPYIECRDQNTGGYGDGFGTASTTGDWIFDHDTWRYNFQDGLDLAHSGMQKFVVTNCLSYGNDGQQYKVGSGDHVLFQNNVALHNCNRVSQTIGDEPATAIVPGVSTCRAAGDGIALNFTDIGDYTFQNNTWVGYGATPYDMHCEGGWDDCSHAASVYQNNILAGVSDSNYSSGQLPGLFYESSNMMPPNGGWAVRDHNLYFQSRYGCPSPLGAGEVCGDPMFTSEPPLTITDESMLDGMVFTLGTGSPALGAGVAIPGLTMNPDGTPKTTPPNIGAY